MTRCGPIHGESTTEDKTNVRKILEAYKDPNPQYYGGIGNKVQYNKGQTLWGGVTGAGGKRILKEAMVDYTASVEGL